MRVCPQCGYEEPAIWRNTKWRLYTEHCHIGDLEIWDPEFAKKLKAAGPGSTIIRAGHKYRLNKSGSYVHRLAVKLCKHPHGPSIQEPNTEKHRSKLLGYVSRQLEEFF